MAGAQTRQAWVRNRHRWNLARPTVIPLRGETVRLLWRSGSYPRIELEDDRLILTLPQPHRRTLSAARSLLHTFFSPIAQGCIALAGALLPCPGCSAHRAARSQPEESVGQPRFTRPGDPGPGLGARPAGSAQNTCLYYELCHLKIRNHSPRFWAWCHRAHSRLGRSTRLAAQHGQALKAELARLVQGSLD